MLAISSTSRSTPGKARRSTLISLLFLGLLGSSVLAMEKAEAANSQGNMTKDQGSMTKHQGSKNEKRRKSVNINTASASTMAKHLVSIGRTKAKRIVAHRKEHGPFNSVDELLEIKGINLRIVKVNEKAITLE